MNEIQPVFTKNSIYKFRLAASPMLFKAISLCILLAAVELSTVRSAAAAGPEVKAPAQADSIAAKSSKAAAIDPKTFHALLVGCTKYDNLKPERSLQGPANDVELMRRFFTDQLQLDKKSIAILSEPEAAAHGLAFRPTRENIEREIQHLVGAAREGDQIVLLLAGHGGQQPERKEPDPTYLKPDGLDQMFLPCDCGQWNGKKWCVDRAIADYELRIWCKQITAKKARLWVILDACCSGWTLRGNSTEVARNLSADDLGIPQSDIGQSYKAAAARPHISSNGTGQRTRGETSKPAAFDFGPQSPDYVGLYAAQRDESELEMLLPMGDMKTTQQKPQGLLTYAVVDILSRASQPITYGELANLVRQRYPQWGRTMGPTPVVEGLAQDREVLGIQRWPGRSRERWQKSDEGDLTINEGQVQGMTPGSILALYPSIDQPDTKNLLCYAQIKDSSLMDSTIKLIRYNETKEARKIALPDGGRFEVIRSDFGSLRTQVGVDFQSVLLDASASGVSAAEKSNSDNLRHLAEELKQGCLQEDSLCEYVDNVKDARWVVQIRGGKLILISQDAAQIRGDLPEDAITFRIPDMQPVAEIMRDMNRIARAQNLLNLTSAQQSAAAGDQNATATQDDFLRPHVELKMLRYQNKTDTNPTEVEFVKGPLELSPGDYVGWRLTNLGQCDVAVSLLYVDAGFGIKAIFPRAGAGTDNMLTKKGGQFTTKPARITANPAGREHVVLIGVPRRPQQQSPDFSCLEQETLVKARGGDENPGLESPLGRLLQNAMYGHGGSRGLDTGDTAESQLLLQSWRVSTKKTP